MRITELFTAQSIALDEAQQDRSQIIDRLVELQATHGNIRDKEAYKKGLYEREDEGSTYVDNGITVPHAKCDCVTRPSLAALRLKTPVQYNAEDDGKTDLLFAIAAPKNGSGVCCGYYFIRFLNIRRKFVSPFGASCIISNTPSSSILSMRLEIHTSLIPS